MADHLLRNRGVFAVGSLKIIPPTSPDRKWITIDRKVGNGIADNQEILAGGLKHDGRAQGPIRCFRPGCAGRVKHDHGPVWPIRCFTLVGADISSDSSDNSWARGGPFRGASRRFIP